MVFYEDFIKKINLNPEKQFKSVEKFSLEFRKKIMWIGTGVPMLLIALYQLYEGYLNDYRVINMLTGIIFFYIGFKHLKTVFSYKIKIDGISNNIYYEKIVINFDDIESCILKEAKIGKKGLFQVVIDIVTKEGKQFIIPLIMNRKLDFVKILNRKLKNKFKVIK
ncbi:MAG: hypothetical protein ACRC0S_00795 [Fusobacteriaceae bacterium]